jgi:teichuronic acid exporter
MFRNIIWDALGKFGGQIVSFGISIVLTRLLTPQEYGIMGMAMVVIMFAHVFLEMGFNRAIIQSNNITHEQLSTVFYLNGFIAIVLMGICYFVAAPLAIFYNQPMIKPVFRVISVSFLLNGLSLVPSALLYKRLHFKSNSLLTLTAAIISGIVGVTMAYNGYGVWSLVVQSLLNSFIGLILYFISAKWFPLFVFSSKSIKPLWSYGNRLFASGVLEALYTRLDTFIIGKIFSVGTLGFYSRAQSIDGTVRQFSSGIILGSLFPYIAKYQHDKAFLKQLYLKYCHILLLISVGVSGILFLTAKPLFTILFTSRWLYSAELYQLMCIAGFVYPISSLMCNVISGVGNSSAFFRLEVYKKLLMLPVYLFGFLLGLKGFIVCMIGVSFFGVMLNASFAGREIGIGLRNQLKIICSYIIIGAFSCLLTWLLYSLTLKQLVPNELLSLFALSFTFASFYLAGIYFSKLKSVEIVSTSFQRIKLAFQ